MAVPATPTLQQRHIQNGEITMPDLNQQQQFWTYVILIVIGFGAVIGTIIATRGRK